MLQPALPPRSFGQPPRGITQSDVSHAADSLLRSGERPTIEKIRSRIGRGSPNTINPMLDAWWKTLSARLDAGPAALHRLPESIAHIAEALWVQALEESRRRAVFEQRDNARLAQLDKERLEIRSEVLTLREGEFDSRLRDRDRTIEELNLRLRELASALRKEQAARESQVRRLTTSVPQHSGRREFRTSPRKSRTPSAPKTKQTARRAVPLRNSVIAKPRKKSARRRKNNRGSAK